MIFFDSHAHLCDEVFNEDRENVIQKCFDSDVKFITEIGYSEETSRKAVELANEYETIFAIVGAHPDECNKNIKFGKMISAAASAGYDKIATGHYARIKKDENGRYLLLRAKDDTKDQSYVLYMLTQKQLSHSIFPLGELSKSQVREIAQKNGFVNADRPSTEKYR